MTWSSVNASHIKITDGIKAADTALDIIQKKAIIRVIRNQVLSKALLIGEALKAIATGPFMDRKGIVRSLDSIWAGSANSILLQKLGNRNVWALLVSHEWTAEAALMEGAIKYSKLRIARTKHRGV